VVTLALNLFTQGVDPGLAFWNLDEVVREAEHCTRLPVHPRHPYAGDLVYTAFSGSHQDAIKKGLDALGEARSDSWEVPYLPIDPKDVGRSYEAVIRINSQSGKGGVAYVLEHDYGMKLPRALQIDFGHRVQRLTDESGGELTSRALWEAFQAEYLTHDEPLSIVGYAVAGEVGSDGDHDFDFHILFERKERRIRGREHGPIGAFVDALRTVCGLDVRIRDYSEHAVGEGADAMAAAYVEIGSGAGPTHFGVGRDPNIVMASLRAVTSAINRASKEPPSK